MQTLLLALTGVILVVARTTAKEGHHIMPDIRSAFEQVTNNTGQQLESTISAMYQEPTQEAFLFKVPSDSANGYTMVSMERSDFMPPIFPNLTTNRRLILAMQRHRRPQQNLKKSERTHDWSLFGLDGWLGAISPSLDTPVGHVENPDPFVLNPAPKKGELGEFTGPPMNQRIQPFHKDTTNNEAELRNRNIFIARVNDPFGQSTMWEMRGLNGSYAEERTKRDVVKLYSMIKCSTGCEPLSYKAYGCFCGFLGTGQPVDGIDRCCKFHDKCYEHSNCVSYLEYFVPYVWKCYRGKPLCAIDHGEWGGPSSCAARLCHCDLQLSRCLRKYACPRSRPACASSRARRLQNLLFLK